MALDNVTKRDHVPAGIPGWRFVRAIATATRAIRRRPARTAMLVALIGPALVSLLLDLLGRKGDILIAVAVSMLLLMLIRVVATFWGECSSSSGTDSTSRGFGRAEDDSMVTGSLFAGLVEHDFTRRRLSMRKPKRLRRRQPDR